MIPLITRELHYKDFYVSYVYNPKLKHSYIKIDTSSNIIVKTPSKSEKFVLALLEEKEKWIMKQIQKNENHNYPMVNLEDEVLLFGELYSVDSQEAEYLRERLSRMKKPTQEKVLMCYDNYYKHYSCRYLSERTLYFAKRMNLEYSSLKYRKMRSRWGSCSSKKVITFNTQLMKLKKELIDYVIVHELSHLVYMNHSKAFHTFVENYLENAQELRRELKNIRLS